MRLRFLFIFRFGAFIAFFLLALGLFKSFYKDYNFLPINKEIINSKKCKIASFGAHFDDAKAELNFCSGKVFFGVFGVCKGRWEGKNEANC